MPSFPQQYFSFNQLISVERSVMSEEEVIRQKRLAKELERRNGPRLTITGDYRSDTEEGKHGL